MLLELARRAQHPAEPLPGSASAVAFELYRQAAYFAVRATAAAHGDSLPPWTALDADTVTRIAGSPEGLGRLVELVEQSDPLGSWERPKEELARDADLLANVTQQLLADFNWRKRARDALLLQRLWRVGLVAVVALVVVWGLRFGLDRSEQARNLALGKPWRASSLVSGFGCRSPQQDCAESPDFFFHTNEEQSPWVEIDLGSRVSFTAVRVINRRDCCFERATPLVVEVSDDQQNYREVARRGSVFSSWLTSFAPKQARFVRVRVEQRTHLHLAEVRVLR